MKGDRRRLRSGPAAAVIALALAAAACSAQSPASQSPAAPPAPQRPAAPAGSVVTPPPSVPMTTATAPAARLAGIAATMLPAAPAPFGVAVAPGGQYAFVVQPASVSVLRRAGPASFTPARAIPLPGGHAAARAAGTALTPDGRYLLVASGSGAVVIAAAPAESGRPDAVLGTLAVPRLAGGSAIEVAVTPDGALAFVSIEYSGEVAVFRLARALSSGFGPADFVGVIRVGPSAVGLAVSPDGRWLYSLSEGQPGASVRAPGRLTVISVARAAADPAAAVVARVTAGYQPVRVILSADGSVAWVSARASDALLAFSTARLRADPARSLLAAVRVGEAPVGLALVAGGSRVIVADSNRFGAPGAPGAASGLDVVSVPAALAGRPAVLGRLPAGGFPREMALDAPAGLLLVTNFASGQVELVPVTRLP